MGYCVGYFDIKGDAAEIYELQVAPTQKDARQYLLHVQQYAAGMQNFQAGFSILLGAMASGYGADFSKESDAAVNAGLRRGVSDSSKATVDAVRRQYEVCRSVLDYVPASAPSPNLAAVVAASEIEAVRQKIRPCWNIPKGVRDQAMSVTLTVEMSQNAYPVSATVRNATRYQTDPAFRAVADAARQAIMNPRCQPWPLSPEKFQSWKTLTFNFDPRDY